MPDLLVERDGGVVTLTLNRPDKMNAITRDMWGELREVFDDVATRTDDRVLVITGAGRGFCGGADLVNAGMPQSSGARLEHMRGVGRSAAALRAIPKPTIAKVNGAAAGAGLNLALGCDLVIASEKATFGQPEIKLGVFAPPATVLLPRRIGVGPATAMLLTGETVGALEAKRLGLVNEVFAVEEFESEAEAWIDKLLALSGAALVLAKRALRESSGLPLGEAHERMHDIYMYDLMATNDAHEGLRAFVEKRLAAWKHR